MDSLSFDSNFDFSAARVLVVGDVMLDRYWSGPAERISREAPVPIVRVEGVDERCGGAANVALNLARLGVQVTLIGAIGDDDHGATLVSLLEAEGVSCRLCSAQGAATTVKLRLLSQHQQLMRLDFEHHAGADVLDKIVGAFAEEVKHHEVVVFSDYGKGALDRISELLSQTHMLGRVALVDPRGTDFSRYRKATAITPNTLEFTTVAGAVKSDEELEEKARQMALKLELQAILVTRGERGMSLVERGREALHIPSEAREVFDVTGAGDTVIAVLAAGLGCGWTMASAARLANRAAGLVVGRLGTAAVSANELGNGRILGGQELVRAVRAAQSSGQRVVMTNGCFDIIHAGHISYLAKAARLGDCLVVAVNSDASVARLKGPDRPINSLEQRLSVISALRFVDWVAAFDGSIVNGNFEDTPADLIAAVLPDILVKGADYAPHEIDGAEAVLANGGEVRTIELVEGVSTTAIVEQIKKSGP